jgi:hypothetical protein
MFEDESHHTRPECRADCPPESFDVDGHLEIAFSCETHGTHWVVDPFEA